MRIVFALPSAAEMGGIGRFYAAGLTSALQGLGHVAELHEDNAPAWTPGTTPVIDGLLLPLLASRLDELVACGAVALIHHVSAQAGRDPAAQEAVQATLWQMLPRLRRVISTSAPVAERLVQAFGVAPDASVVIEPGADHLPRTQAPDGACRILSVGVLTPRKGHDRLLRALARLPDLDWVLTIAGASARDPAHAAALQELILELGLSDRAQVVADADTAALEPLWRDAGLFALATRWEGYPAGVTEALRRGIPVVVTDYGAAERLVPPEAGAVCAPDDLATLSKVLRRILFDRTVRAQMAEGAWHAGQNLPDWTTQARLFETALKE